MSANTAFLTYEPRVRPPAAPLGRTCAYTAGLRGAPRGLGFRVAASTHLLHPRAVRAHVQQGRQALLGARYVQDLGEEALHCAQGVHVALLGMIRVHTLQGGGG